MNDSIKFEETVTKSGLKCPKCGKNTVVRIIHKEPCQGKKGRWYVERCENKGCDYWRSGFT